MLVSLVFVLLCGPTHPARAADDPHALADLALDACEMHRYGECARVLDRVQALTPHSRYLLGAAEAWALTGDLTAAEVRLGMALMDPTLEPGIRPRIESLLARVRAAAPHAARARASAPAHAARAWEAALAASDIGHFLVEAGLAWEAAQRHEAAFEAFSRALARTDLPDDDLRLLPGHLATVQALMPPPPPDRTAAWLTAGFATAAAIFAAGAFVTAEDHRDDVRLALSDDPVTTMTRAQAQKKQAISDDWHLAGWIGIGATVALVTTSVALFSIPPEPRATLHLRAAVGPGSLSLAGSF